VAVAGCGAPDPVERAFAERHPGVDAQWEQQPYGWEAAFTASGVEHEVEFDDDGRWLETEREVVPGAGDPTAGFPPAVIDAIRRDGISSVGKWEIEETPAGTFYEIEPSTGDGEYYYDGTGAPAPNTNEDA
jgi:hypothetical protein